MSRATLTLILLSTLVVRCDDPFIDPFVEGRHFTVYGYLGEFDDEHSVRVIPVRRFPETINRPGDPHAEIDARVKSTDVATGEEHVWRHQLLRLDDGTYGHVFGATFVVRRGHTYELRVTRSDGAQSTARTTVPNLTEWRLEPATIGTDDATQALVWLGASTPDYISISYCAKVVGGFGCDPVLIPYDRKGHRVDDGWQIDIDLTHDLRSVREKGGFDDETTLELASMEMLFTALDSKWVVPEQPIDMNEFAQPDGLTNVENGFGFWGSLSRSSAQIKPDAGALALAGFVLPPTPLRPPGFEGPTQ